LENLKVSTVLVTESTDSSVVSLLVALCNAGRWSGVHGPRRGQRCPSRYLYRKSGWCSRPSLELDLANLAYVRDLGRRLPHAPDRLRSSDQHAVRYCWRRSSRNADGFELRFAVNSSPSTADALLLSLASSHRNRAYRQRSSAGQQAIISCRLMLNARLQRRARLFARVKLAQVMFTLILATTLAALVIPATCCIRRPTCTPTMVRRAASRRQAP